MKPILSSLRENIVLWMRDVLSNSVAKNAVSLYLIQFADYILPLITVPYLVKALGLAGFGMVAFSQSLIAYLALFVDYGFALSATRKISVERDNPVAVSHTVFNIWAAKTILCVAGFMALFLLISVVPKLQGVSTLLMVLYCTVIGNVLFPVWLFQGMEKMIFISMINLVMKLLVVAGIFTLVHQPKDYLVYAWLTSIGSIGAGLTGLVVALSKFKLRVVLPSLRGIREALKEGWILFLSMASISLYTVGNAFILGLLTNHTVVGYYAAAEKIVKGILGLLSPISQAAYPRFSKMASESKELTIQWGQRMLHLMGGLGFILSITTFVGAPLIVKIVLGPNYEPSIMVMRILAGLCFLISISNVLGAQIMFPFHYEKAVFAVVLTAGIINIVLALLLVPLWRANGMALSVLVSEAFVTISCFYYLWEKRLNPFKQAK